MQARIEHPVHAESDSRLRTRRKVHVQRALAQTLRILFVTVLALLYVLPFIWMLSSSFEPESNIFQIPPEWIPHPFTLHNYRTLFTEMPFWLDIWHTTYITLFNVIATVISCALVAYGFSRIRWSGREFLFLVLIASLILPYQVVMVPQYLIFKWIGWLNSYKPLTWPAFTGNAFFIFLLRQFMLGIPLELQDAAEIDGANEFRTFTSIAMPLIRPALATVALFTFMGTWTDFLSPLIYLDSPSLETIALGMFKFLGAHGTDWGALMSGTLLTSLPVVVIFFLTQKTFVEGIALTGTTK